MHTKSKHHSTCSTGKIQHDNGLSALNHITRLRFFHGQTATSYVCPECNYIHITTQQQRLQKRIAPSLKSL
jgi:hypothetical protein